MKLVATDFQQASNGGSFARQGLKALSTGKLSDCGLSHPLPFYRGILSIALNAKALRLVYHRKMV
jgi:hypothetical protein